MYRRQSEILVIMTPAKNLLPLIRVANYRRPFPGVKFSAGIIAISANLGKVVTTDIVDTSRAY
jgi:hypothetical protein